MRHLIVLVIASCLATGCASIISGSHQNISVNSNVQGASVYLDGQLLGATPLTASIDRGKVGVLKISADGYAEQTVGLSRTVNGFFFLNILVGGFFGSSTDLSTGAVYEYSPSTFYVPLEPKHASREELERAEKREALRRFVLMNHEALIHDLARGEGPHLQTLVAALDLSGEAKVRAIEGWGLRALTVPDPLAFADSIVAGVDG